jgi:ribosome-associated toxin RatA of RatAB toxin-antitoxin module
MGSLDGTHSVDIDAPLERVFAIVADIEKAPAWQVALKEAHVLERDAEGRPLLVDTVADAQVKELSLQLRFSYLGAPHRIAFEKVNGDLKKLVGTWELEELGPARTRVSYTLHGDPGRMLGMLIRGPVEDRIHEALIHAPIRGLKVQAEDGAAAA